ncbi:tetratricopeptide repeat protein, partial [Pseudomonas sp. 2822-15]|uniref:tetratricopeptide repeat protein n=1 Tax=Pseudomonas sp. 2822-15 TaxID=1712677 RepID=UPI00117BB164
DDGRAVTFFKKAIELDGNLATAYYGQGNAYFNQQEFLYAIDAYQEALNKGLKEGDVYYMLGMSFYHHGDLTRALPSLQRASEINPTDLEANFQYG